MIFRSVQALERSALKAERLVNAGKVRLAIAESERTLDLSDRIPAWRRSSNLVIALLQLTHRTLQNAYREYPGQQWRALHHLEMAKALARDLPHTQQELERLHLDDIAVTWILGDMDSVKMLFRNGAELSTRGHPLRELFLGRRAEFLHASKLYSHEANVLREVRHAEPKEVSAQHSSIYLQAALLALQTGSPEESQRELDGAFDILRIGQSDYFMMLAHYHQARLHIVANDRQSARNSFTTAENFRLTNSLVVRGVEDLVGEMHYGSVDGG